MLISVMVVLVTAVLSLSFLKIFQSSSEQTSLTLLSARAFEYANSGTDIVLTKMFVESEGCLNNYLPRKLNALKSASSCSFSKLMCHREGQLYVITSSAICQIGNCNDASCLRASRAVKVKVFNKGVPKPLIISWQEI